MHYYDRETYSPFGIRKRDRAEGSVDKTVVISSILPLLGNNSRMSPPSSVQFQRLQRFHQQMYERWH